MNIQCYSGDLVKFKANGAAHINSLIGFKRSDVSNYVMLSSALKELQTLTGFTQIRFWCRIDAAAKQLNIVTKNNDEGANVIKYLTSNSTTSRPNSCDSYTQLSGDNSALGSDCSRWTNGKWNTKGPEDKLFYRTMKIDDAHFWSLDFSKGNFDCDTFNRKTVAKHDFWFVFVR